MTIVGHVLRNRVNAALGIDRGAMVIGGDGFVGTDYIAALVRWSEPLLYSRSDLDTYRAALAGITPETGWTLYVLTLGFGSDMGPTGKFTEGCLLGVGYYNDASGVLPNIVHPDFSRSGWELA